MSNSLLSLPPISGSKHSRGSGKHKVKEVQVNDSLDMDEQYADGWRPEPGAVLVGTVTDLGKGWSDYSGGRNYPIVTVEKDDGEKVAIHCFHTVLEKKMKELRPTVGEVIGVKFIGKQPTKDGTNEFANYNVKVKGRSVDIWGDTPAPVDLSEAVPAATTSDTGEDEIPF